MRELPRRANRPGRDPDVEEDVDEGAVVGTGVCVRAGVDVEADVEGVFDVLADGDAAAGIDDRGGWLSAAAAGGVEGDAGVGDGEEGEDGVLSLSLVSLAAVEAPGSAGNDTDAEADDVDTPPLPRDAGMGVARRARAVAGRCNGRRDAVAGSCVVRRYRRGSRRLVGEFRRSWLVGRGSWSGASESPNRQRFPNRTKK